jgi:ABC-type lipoprotein export system ATPase subunit
MQGQRGAVFMSLTTKEKFTTVQGPSGTGKTIMMEAAVLYGLG